MDELNYLKKWLDGNIDEHTTAPIGEIDTKTLAEAIIKEGFSRRPELVQLNEKLVKKSVGEALEIGRFTGGAFMGTDEKIAKHICAKFTAPEAKHGLSVEEIENVLDVFRVFEDSYTQTDYKNARKHLAQAIHDAQPASSVNAEVVEALQALLVAVCYKTPTVDFGTQKEPNPCYEARVPVQFVHDAHKALNSIKAGKDTKCS